MNPFLYPAYFWLACADYQFRCLRSFSGLLSPATLGL